MILRLLAVCSLVLEIFGCEPVCNDIEMNAGVVPSVYRNCTCVQEADEVEDYDFVFDPVPCIPLYRSLKFRNATSGKVLLHKAVTRACVTDYSIRNVDQSEFLQQERDYYYNLLARRHAKPSSVSSWLFGFKSSFIRTDPDNHLRFG